jgi:hypothetical protein
MVAEAEGIELKTEAMESRTARRIILFLIVGLSCSVFGY